MIDDRRDPWSWLALGPAIPVSVVAWAAILGLGVGRQGDAAAVALTATLLVYGPAIAVGAVGDLRRRLTRVGLMLLAWSLGLLLAMPVYFPGERREAVATGLALLTGNPDGDGVAASLARALPDEPDLAVAQVPVAKPVEAEVLPPPQGSPDQDAIELPYEGEGRRLSIQVAFEQDGVQQETSMMLDTGATYTTLPMSVLAAIGATPLPGAPELTLNTANGQRQARVVLLDRVWLGDLPLDGVAVTTCEDCASDENAGLLGLNVTGGYNLHIDADRKQVVFTKRAKFDRKLDIRPFVGLEARFLRFPGGRVEVEIDLDNPTRRAITASGAKLTCGSHEWSVDVGAVGSGERTSVRRRLPLHERCDGYHIELEQAYW